MRRYIDLSLPIDGRFRYKLDVERYSTYQTNNRQATRFCMSAHAFTHVDAPIHMAGKDKKTITDYPVEYFIGEASLIDVPRGPEEPITDKDLDLAGKHCKDGDIVFIRSGWLEKMWGKEEFIDSPYLTDDAAEWLVNLKARIAGYDFIQDRIVKQLTLQGEAPTEGFTAHLILLGNGVLNLEHVNNLSQINVPRFRAYVMPIKLKDFDGAPCRAVAEI